MLLAKAKAKAKAQAKAKAEPKVEARLLEAYAPVLDAVRGMGWPAHNRVRSVVAGPHSSTARGSSAEFVEYRPYRQGDDPRRIDWKLLARTDRVYTRLSEVQTTLATVLVVDASASMAFPEETLGKWDHARKLAVALAAVARHRGDPVGLVVAEGGEGGADGGGASGAVGGGGAAGLRIIPPRTRRTVLEEMMLALETAPLGGARLAPAAAEALRLGSRVVMISDFLGDLEAQLAVAKTAAAEGKEVYALHVVDPLELEPDPKKLLVSDPEEPSLRRPMSARARADYIERFAAWRESVAREWRRAGASYSLVVPDEEPYRLTVRRITHAGAGEGRVGGGRGGDRGGGRGGGREGGGGR